MTRDSRIALRRRLTDDLDSVVDRVVGRVRDDIPAYAAMGTAQATEVRAITAWMLRRLLDIWVDEAPVFEPADLHRLRGIGAARAADGRPAIAVSRAYRVAAVELSTLIGTYAEGLDVEDVLQLNRVMLEGGDAIAETLGDAYERHSERLSSDREQILGELAADLLVGRQTSRPALADRAHQLGIDVPSTWSMTVVQAAPDGAPVTDDDLATTGALLRTRRDGTGVLLDSQESATAMPGWRGCVVTGVPTAALPQTYRLAVGAVEHAPATAFVRRALLDRGDAELVALLRGTPEVAPGDLADHVLAGLREPQRAHLLDGLRAYLRHGSATEAARATSTHPQTVRYRLRRVSELTGRDVRDPWDRLALDLASTIDAVGS